MTKNDLIIFGLIAQAPNDTVRDSMLTNIGLVRGITTEQATAMFAEFETSNAKTLAATRRKAMIERLNQEAGDMTLKSADLSDFVARVLKCKGKVSLNADLSLEVTLPGSGSGRGGGRVANDHKQPFVDANGVRVEGPITFWLDKNVPENKQADIKGVFRPNGKRRSGATLTKALVDAGILTDSPVPEAEVSEDSAEDSSEA
jgi:hypothetical protein